jgi:hypothetical protein
MKANDQQITPPRNRPVFSRWIICGAVLLPFAAGWLVTASVTYAKKVSADTNHVFELMIYHTNPGKATELEDLFRGDSKVMAQHGIKVIGFWMPNEKPEWKDTFVYLLDFPSREDAKKRWTELRADPAGRPYIEAAKLILEKVGENYHVEEIFMRPSDFSPMK